MRLTRKQNEEIRRWGNAKKRAIAAFLANPPTNIGKVCGFIDGQYGGGSHERPHLVAVWAEAIDGEEAGRAFWAVMQDEWSSFDRIPHPTYVRLFEKFAPQWTATDAINGLPDQLTVYRGQSRDAPVGLSWTHNKLVADGFARGHRGISVPNGTVLERRISRKDVALVINDRDEQEIVLWR
jgi:hypothetical protein